MVFDGNEVLKNPVNLSQIQPNQCVVLPLYDTNLFFNHNLELDGVREDVYYELKFEDGKFITPMGVGSPPQSVVWIIDTGSPLTWTICKPCDRCPESPPFDSSVSRSFKKVDCYGRNECIGDFQCDEYPSHDCRYDFGYADGRAVAGFMVYDRVTHPSSRDTIVDRLKFGCTNNWPKRFKVEGPITGLVGLNQDPESFIQQFKAESFSFCCAPEHSFQQSRFILNAPTEETSSDTVRIPIRDKKYSYHYDLTLAGIAVGEDDYVAVEPKKINNSILATIDTGARVSWLPQGLYGRFRDTFKKHMLS
ncbi:OLC1v1007593C1 [Oldenlandia corymbosa var. corymbosa]|uniref:OLC1v1007593C1 n=1 Tax=Oldenlandia corymbosa var. corymbosa TaxID=529605 RepID=A0AAV1DJM4_OLDCO|nr:OLC1v1007593C1 [Oldenlandia corymbosa var. corymbosa]